MAEKKKNIEESEAKEPSELEEEAVEEVKPTEEEAPTEEESVSKAEYAELYDKYLRLVAEFDNFKKRTQKEKDEIYSIAKTDVVMNLLPVIDNFDRAEKFAGDESVAEGIALIKKQFLEFLKKIFLHTLQILSFQETFTPFRKEPFCFRGNRW